MKGEMILNFANLHASGFIGGEYRLTDRPSPPNISKVKSYNQADGQAGRQTGKPVSTDARYSNNAAGDSETTQHLDKLFEEIVVVCVGVGSLLYFAAIADGGVNISRHD